MKVALHRLLPALSVAFLLSVSSYASASETSLPSRSQDPPDVGIIFSADNLLLGITDYQAGIGAKLNLGDFGIRGLLDLVVNGSSQSFLLDLGGTVEYHFRPGRISPYVGAYLGGGYTTQASISSAVTLSVGVLAGVELFIYDFLSVFAEYDLGVDLSWTTDLQTSQLTFDYLAGTRMGNNAKLGIVIYLFRPGQKAK